jgi:hypothetical protein
LLARAGNARAEVIPPMRRFWILGLVLAPASAVAVACGDDDVFAPAKDAGSSDSALPDTAAGDSGPGVRTCGDAGGAPPRFLVTIGSASAGEMAAVNTLTNAVDGRLTIPGKFGGNVETGNREPFVIAQEADTVFRLDSREPWKTTASWNVKGDDAIDGGKPNANPAAVAVPACNKGYVLRFNRNKIAVIDTGEDVTNGTPKSFIDLTPQLQAADTDGIVEMTSAIWVESKKLVYVLLANVDLNKVAGDGYTALCATTKPSIVAIDPATDQVVGSPIMLEGYNPPLGTPFWYDWVKERFLVLSAGCNLAQDDGGPGAVSRRRIEEVDIASGTVKTLLSLDDQGFPGAFEYIDATHAAVGFFGQAFYWDPTTTALGAPIPGGMDFFGNDGRGTLFGARATFLDDGGAGPIQIVSAPLVDGGFGDAAVIAQDPFTKNGGYMSSASVWPKP